MKCMAPNTSVFMRGSDLEIFKMLQTNYESLPKIIYCLKALIVNAISLYQVLV